MTFTYLHAFLLYSKRFYSAWIMLLLVLTQTSHAQSSGELPLEAFYQGSVLSNVKLSPDGTHLLALKNVDEFTAVMVLNIATGETFYPTKTDNQEFKFNWVSWANNDRILMSLRFDSRLLSGLKFSQTRLLAMDAKKPSKMINIGKYNKSSDELISQFQDNVINMLWDDPDHVLLSVDRESHSHQTVYKANVNTGRLTRVKRFSNTTRSWEADRQGNIRAGESYDDRTRKVAIRILDPTTETWVNAWEYVIFDEPSIEFMGFGKNSNEVYLLADHEGRQAVFKADLSKPGYPRELILSDPDYDISGELIYSPTHQDVVGLYYSGGSDKSVFWNKEFKTFQAGIDKVLPDTSNYITSFSADSRKYILHTSNSTQPGSIYYGDRDKKTLDNIASLFPPLTEEVLAEKQLLTYKARDGLELEGYLSLPKKYAGKPIATIILPHGGPMSQDGKSFDSFSAYMVNRGYAVFQPNFRGSSGYGHDFMMMAVGGMGLAMQDDLEDAVKFLVEKNYTDPKRVGIVGGSYGGYAALMGATKTPDLFQCAISFAGISDINKLRDRARFYINKNVIREQLGNDKQQLRQTSPARLAEQVKIPILLIHGIDDTVVPFDQSQRMASALKKHNKTYQFIELEGGSHYLDYLPHRKQTFEAMDAFLKKYLPATQVSSL